MAWNLLLLAGLFEIAWAIGMKLSNGFTHPGYTVFTFVTSLVSFVLLGLAMKELPASTGYAVWTGIGAIGTAIIGMVFLDEPRTAARIVSIALIVAGVIGLKLFGAPVVQA
jgi:quaternary ammonium compound-resistance protein SugE